MSKVVADFTVKYSIKIEEDSNGEKFYESSFSFKEKDNLKLQACHIHSCIEYIKKEIEDKTAYMIKVPAKYFVILEGLEEELSYYRALITQLEKDL